MIELTLTTAQCQEILDALANQRADMQSAYDDCRVERVRNDIATAKNDSWAISHMIRSALGQEED